MSGLDATATVEGPGRVTPRRRRDLEAGDTLVEVLLAVAVLGIVAGAILLAFSTSIFGSSEYRGLATIDTVLRNAAEEATTQLQSNVASFACPTDALTAYQGEVTFTSPGVPTAYSAELYSVSYWSGTGYTTTSCTTGEALLVDVQVTPPTGVAQHIDFVVDDPNDPNATTLTGDEAAAQIAFVAQPSGGTAGSALFPAPAVAVENAVGSIITDDLSPVNLAIKTGGGSLADCSGTEFGGVVTFNGCQIDAVGSYTLVATDGSLTSPDSTQFSITAGPAAQLAFTTEPGNGTGGLAFGQPVVTVEDAYNNPVASDASTVTLAIGTNPSGGTLGGCSQSEAAGVVTFSGCEINTAGNDYTLVASDGSLTAATSGTFNITVGTAAQLGFTTSPGASTGGATFATQPVVSVEDAGGNVVATGLFASVPVTLSIETGGGTGAGTLTCTTNQVTATKGVATFAGCKIALGTQGSFVLQAAATGLTTGTSASFTVAGTASQLVFTTSPGASTGGTAFTAQPVVTVEDSSGDPVTTGTASTASVTLSVDTGTGTLACSSNPVTASAGVATFAGCKITLGTQGAFTLQASASGPITGVSPIFTVAGTASQVAFLLSPGNGTGGSAFSAQPVVAVEDSSGDVVTTNTSTVSLAIGTNPGGGTLSGCVRSASAGVTAFSGCTINAAGTGYTLTATDGTLGAATSSPFNVTVGPAAQLVFTASPGTTAAGAAFATQPAVSVEDAGGNVVTTDSSQVTVILTPNSGGGSLACSTDPVAASGGVATFAGCRIDAAGTGYTLTASDGSLPPATSGAFAITAGPAAQLAFAASPSNSAGGAIFATQPVVDVEDAYGNLVATNTSMVSLTIGTNPGGGTLTCGANPISAAAGIATFSGCEINAAGTGYTLTAADGSLAAATSNPFNITSLLTGLTPTSGPVGTAATIVAQGYAPNSTLTVTVGGAPATITSGTTTSAAGGSSVAFTVPAVPNGPQAVVVTDGAGNSATSPTPFTVTGSATGLNPASGPVGTSASLGVQGLAAGSTLTVTVGGVSAPVTAGAMTSAAGSATVTFTIPAVPHGPEAVVVNDATGDTATSATPFAVTASATGLTPTSGPAGTSAALTAQGFAASSNLTVTVGGVKATITAGGKTGTNGASTVTFTVPAAPAGMEPVVVTDAAGDSATSPTDFTLATSLSGLTPTSGPVGTSAAITAQGYAGSSHLTVTVGGVTAAITSGGTTSAAGAATVVFTVPALPHGAQAVVVSDASGDTAVSPTPFTVTSSLSGLTPTAGPVGTAATITAQGYAPTSTLTVTVGGVTAAITAGGTTSAAGTSTVAFTVPALPHGAQAVVVTDVAGDTATSPTAFTITGSASGLSPTSGPVGTSASLGVQGLAAGSKLTVTVGGVNATVTAGGTTSAAGAATVAFTVPAVPHGAEAVVVTDAAGDTATSSFSVTASATGLTPTSGPVGTSVTITAQGFAATSNLTVMVAGTKATVTAGGTTGTNGASTVTFMVPAVARGAEAVVVTDAAGNTATSATAFTVAAMLSGLTPTSGPVGTSATITAQDYAPTSTLTVTVGGVKANVTAGGTTTAGGAATVTFTVPALPHGAQAVVVTDVAGDTATSPTPFTVTGSATGLSPASGPVGTSASLSVQGLAAGSSLMVTVDGVTAPVTAGGTTSATGLATVTFTVPAVPHGAQTVVVTDGSGDAATSATPFAVTGSATALSPASGPVGTSVSALVQGLATSSKLTVTVGGVNATVTAGGTTAADGMSTVTFTVPAVPHGAQTVIVTDGVGDTATSSFSVTTSATGLTPATGAAGSSAQITAQGFAASSHLTVTVGGTAATVTAGATTGTNGASTVTFTVPVSLAGGQQPVVVTDAAGDTATSPTDFRVRGTVQTAQAMCASGCGTTTAVPLAQMTQAGDLVVVSVAEADTSASVVVKDGAANGYDSVTLTPVGNDRQTVAYALDATPTSTVTVTTGAAPADIAVTVTEFAGYTDLDASATATGATKTDFNSGTTPTTTFANDLLVGTLGWTNASATYTVTGSGTYTPTTEETAGTVHEELAYEAVAGTGAYGFSGTTASAISDWGAQVYAFAAPTLTLAATASHTDGDYKVTFKGTSTTTDPITVDYCTGTDTACTASSTTFVGSTTVTPTGNTWAAPALDVSGDNPYTAEAYATDAEGDSLASGPETFTG